MNRTPAFAEEIRRHTSAVILSRQTYFDEQDNKPQPRIDRVRVCLVRDCGTSTRSQLQLCKEHRP